MRVLFTTAWYPNRKVAGDGVFIKKHAHAVAQINEVAVLMVQTDVAVRGWRVEICPTAPSSGQEGVCLVYVPKVRFEIPVLTGLIRLAWLMIGYLKGYRYICRRWWQGQRPEVCHVNVLTRAAGLPWLLFKLHRIPYIITEHWTRYARPDAYPQTQMQLRLGRLFVREAAYVCPVSLNLEQAMKKWGLDSRHYTRIGNVVDTDTFSLPSWHEISRQKCHFVHVSWMRDAAKNISGILRTISRLKERRQDFHLTLIGEGNDKPQLMALADELGLMPDYVTFADACSGADLAHQMQQSDAMLMFSYFENQPVSILEALSCGLPVIATSIAAIPGMLAQKRGVTVSPGDEIALLEVLDQFLTFRTQMTEEQLRSTTLAEARHDYVVQNHSPQVIARRFDVLYRASMASND